MTPTPSSPSFILFCIPLFIATCLPLVATAFSELKRTHLKGCVLIENPYVVKDVTKRSGFNGIAISYLERLQDNLQFTIDLELWEGSWAAFIDVMAECSHDPLSSRKPCPCHLGVGSFTMTNERVNRINFVWPLSNEAHAMVSRKSDLLVDDSQNAWFVFKTFTPSVWIVIIFGVFMHAVGTLFFGPFCEKATEAARSPNCRGGAASASACSCTSILWLIKRFPAAVLFAYSHLVGHPFGERAHGTPSFHRAAWLVLGVTTGLFLLTVYEASLTVLLFESTKESPFRTLTDITDCNLDPGRVAIINGGASQKFWNRAVNTSDNIARCQWDKVGFTVDDLEQGFMFVKNGKADYFYSLEGSVKFRANRNCKDFEQVGEPFFSTSVGFVMAKRADKNILNILSNETRILREQDAYESASLLAARNSCEDVVDATITSGRLAAFFVMYAVVWTLLLLYRFVFLWKRKNEKALKNQAAATQGDIVVMDMHSMPTRNITGIAGFSEQSYETYYEEHPQP